jgi:hypothetical protein
LAKPEDAGSGATRILILGVTDARLWGNLKFQGGNAERCEIRDETETHRSVSRGAKFRGGSEFHHRQGWRMRESGQPEDSSEARLEERGFGATWRFDSGGAEGREIRGNSEIRRRHCQRSEVSSAARSFTFDAAGGCRIRGNPETHRKVLLGE